LVKDSEGTLVGEVESRLEDLFGGGDEVPGAGGNEGESGEFFVREGVGVYAGDEKGDFPSGEPDDSPEFIEDADFLDDSKTLRYLESVVLSIDWEISDETMGELIAEAERLKGIYGHDKTLVILFQLLGSVGKYLKSNKGGAHPDSISLLNSIYATLEKVILSKGMTDAERKRELFVQVNKFKQLKEEIRLTKGGAGKRRKVSSPGIPEPLTREVVKEAVIEEESRKAIREAASSDVGHMLPHEAFAFALEEIKEVIKAEFKALRAELKLWRDGQ